MSGVVTVRAATAFRALTQLATVASSPPHARTNASTNLGRGTVERLNVDAIVLAGKRSPAVCALAASWR
ncbi:hypothetical protein [Plantactinospora mayteni]|uniref:hypothetical protein n=1 Tax=Plantactinospora mayteni TaxID=566021 RepID=UPI001941F44D|nr:hypothetical protein [Plantactinospora mayteni]